MFSSVQFWKAYLTYINHPKTRQKIQIKIILHSTKPSTSRANRRSRPILKSYPDLNIIASCLLGNCFVKQPKKKKLLTLDVLQPPNYTKYANLHS